MADDNGKAVGYIIGSADTGAQREAFDRLIVPRIIRRAFTRTLFRHPGDVLFLLGLTDHAEYEKELFTEDLVTKFPAHLHMNVLPEYQRQGLGGRLMARFLDSMRAAGAPGRAPGHLHREQKGPPLLPQGGLHRLQGAPHQALGKEVPADSQDAGVR